MKIIDKESFIKWLQIQLGEPVIKVELAIEQFETIIDQQIEIFHRYNYGDGNIYEYGLMQLNKGQTEYNLRSLDQSTVASALGQDTPPDPDVLEDLLQNATWETSYINIQDVLEVKSTGGRLYGGINQLFTPAHGWFYYGGGAGAIGMYPGYGRSPSDYGLDTYGYGGSCTNGPAGGPDSGSVTTPGMSGLILGNNTQVAPLMPLSNYVQFRQNLAMIEHLFGERKQAIWRPDAGILRIYPTPYTTDLAMVRYYKKEQAVYLYNNPLFQDLAIAACGMHWGNNVKKYNINMAAGGSINGEAIYSQYKEMYDSTMERIKGESWQPYFYIG